MSRSDIELPLAMWRGMRGEMSYIDQKCKRFEKDGSSSKSPRLERDDLQHLLSALNGNQRPSNKELDWFLSRGTLRVTFHYSCMRAKAVRVCLISVY